VDRQQTIVETPEPPGAPGWPESANPFVQCARSEEGHGYLARFGPGLPFGDPTLPLADLSTTGEGRGPEAWRHGESPAGLRMRPRAHRARADGIWSVLEVESADPRTGLVAVTRLRTVPGLGVVRAETEVRNEGGAPIALESVASLTLGGLPIGDVDVHWADNDWLGEGRWARSPARGVLPDLNMAVHGGGAPRSRFTRSAYGTWSSGGSLPMGALTDRGSGCALLWQIEHNGAWRWQLSERRHGLCLSLFGPTEPEHQWRQTLAPGETFTSVPVAVASTDAGFEDAAARMTRYRRLMRRPHPDLSTLSVIYNDYMNTLSGDPTTERLLPLIDAAAEAGAEYFVIDAGWYDDGGLWWDSVGAWRPSARRFPGGLGEVIGRIRERGMVPGLWLEPEVAGVASELSARLPDAAFFQRGGVRVTEHLRHQLDLRHPAARAHLDETVDRLVREFGIGYFKLDYNINPGAGTDVGGLTPGAGLLGHNRAYLDWLDGVLDRHPGLVIESCSSGGMRTDYAQLSRAQLHSTSDQQDYRLYPPIAAAAPLAVAPEQAAVWAYPQPDFTDDEIAFTLCSALLLRIHLSGFLNRMDADQRALVHEAVHVYKALRGELAEAVPFWPLGLPGWVDPALALGQRTADGGMLLAVWRRAPGGPVTGPSPAEIRLPLPDAPEDVRVTLLYPGSSDASVSWDAAARTLAVTLPRAPQACVLRVAAPQFSAD
jgi:alpha-galactosidase